MDGVAVTFPWKIVAVRGRAHAGGVVAYAAAALGGAAASTAEALCERGGTVVACVAAGTGGGDAVLEDDQSARIVLAEDVEGSGCIRTGWPCKTHSEGVVAAVGFHGVVALLYSNSLGEDVSSMTAGKRPAAGEYHGEGQTASHFRLEVRQREHD